MKVNGALRSLCTGCARFGERNIEIEGRLRELFSYATWEGFVPNKHRRKVKLLVGHFESKVARVAKELLFEDNFQRQISAAHKDREWDTLDQLQTDLQTWLACRGERVGEETAERFL